MERPCSACRGGFWVLGFGTTVHWNGRSSGAKIPNTLHVFVYVYTYIDIYIYIYIFIYLFIYMSMCIYIYIYIHIYIHIHIHIHIYIYTYIYIYIYTPHWPGKRGNRRRGARREWCFKSEATKGTLTLRIVP